MTFGLVAAVLGAGGTAGAASAAVIAAVFLWAGTVKLFRPQSTAASFRSLQLPVPGVLARIVPAVEITIGAVTLGDPRVGCSAAVVMLVAFTVVLAIHVRKGSDASCGCFGTAGAEPVSWVSLARNVGMIGLAAATVALSSSSPASPTYVFSSAPWPVVICALSITVAGALSLSLLHVRHELGSVFSQQVQP